MPPQALLPGFRAVIFDMDGVVLDSEPAYVRAWRQAAAEFGAKLEDDFVHGLFGLHAEDVERAMAKKIGAGFAPDRFRVLAAKHWWAEVEAKGIPPMPGVDELLELLDFYRIPYGLATNSDGLYATECLRLAGLDRRFSVLLTRDQVAAGKPEPELFLEAARRMGVSASDCLVLEDSSTGLRAARRAGAIAVLVLGRPATEDMKALAAASFSSLREVAEHVRAQGGFFNLNEPKFRR